MSLFDKVLHRFHDILTGGQILWYEKAYNDCRDGMGHSDAHPEVETHFEIIRQAIESPSNITEDKDYRDRNCYYAWFSGGHDYQTKPHMKVVVRVRKNKKKNVITAYFCDYGGSNERQIPWKTN